MQALTTADPSNAPLSELIVGLFTDVSGLLRKEIDLAKTEASETLSKALSGIEGLVIGLVLAIGAVSVLLSDLLGGLGGLTCGLRRMLTLPACQ